MKRLFPLYITVSSYHIINHTIAYHIISYHRQPAMTTDIPISISISISIPPAAEGIGYSDSDSDSDSDTHKLPPPASPSAAARKARRIAQGYIPSPLKKQLQLQTTDDDADKDEAITAADSAVNNQKKDNIRSIPQLEETAERLKVQYTIYSYRTALIK
jgi:hypothetical protein